MRCTVAAGRTGEFVAINCGALPRDLLATELFGYEGGAFTGARETGAVGKFEYADGGTLFLDEIGEMPVDMQVSLLRVLQEQSVTKLGSNTAKTLDVRVIAATNQNIERLIAEKKFRSDLYYRLSLVEVRLPQLRRRADDIPLLVDYFNGQLSSVLEVPCTPFPAETIEALRAYSWPGNVRELRNIVERCLIMQGEGANVTVDSLPAPHRERGQRDAGRSGGPCVVGRAAVRGIAPDGCGGGRSVRRAPARAGTARAARRRPCGSGEAARTFARRAGRSTQPPSPARARGAGKR